ncbi:MAG: hypothetical protein P8Y91_04515 [Desulfuromonadales bacterium]|jgi:hypothetical protein
MTGYELKQKLADSDTSGRHFIKWWRKENDFVDFELIDRFLEHLQSESEFEGYELLDMEQMWQELKNRDPEGVWVEKHHGEKVIHWRHAGHDGESREDTYRYVPEALMALFDKETRGDTLC